jgi:hypothetical protein
MRSQNYINISDSSNIANYLTKSNSMEMQFKSFQKRVKKCFFCMMKIVFFYFPTTPHSGKLVVLLQIAVRLTVEYFTTRLVTVKVPNDNKKRLGLPSGAENPDSISNGISEDSSTGALISSKALSLEI